MENWYSKPQPHKDDISCAKHGYGQTVDKDKSWMSSFLGTLRVRVKTRLRIRVNKRVSKCYQHQVLEGPPVCQYLSFSRAPTDSTAPQTVRLCHPCQLGPVRLYGQLSPISSPRVTYLLRTRWILLFLSFQLVTPSDVASEGTIQGQHHVCVHGSRCLLLIMSCVVMPLHDEQMGSLPHLGAHQPGR